MKYGSPTAQISKAIDDQNRNNREKSNSCIKAPTQFNAGKLLDQNISASNYETSSNLATRKMPDFDVDSAKYNSSQGGKRMSQIGRGISSGVRGLNASNKLGTGTKHNFIGVTTQKAESKLYAAPQIAVKLETMEKKDTKPKFCTQCGW